MKTDAATRTTVALKLGLKKARIYQTALIAAGWLLMMAFNLLKTANIGVFCSGNLMKRFLLIAIVCILGVISCRTSDRNDSTGRSNNVDGINVIGLEGSWLQMGRQYGILEKSQLNIRNHFQNPLPIFCMSNPWRIT